MKTTLALPHGTVDLPAFMPDATYGFVRGLSAADLKASGCRILMMNAFHLARSPGASVVRELGGLHAMSGWDGPICTDSGGFQAFSLLQGDPKAGTLSKKGLTIRPPGKEKKIDLTPEKAVETQLNLGADLLFCLDVCTAPGDSAVDQARSVDLTIDWAARCKETFDRLTAQRRGRAGDGTTAGTPSPDPCRGSRTPGPPVTSPAPPFPRSGGETEGRNGCREVWRVADPPAGCRGGAPASLPVPARPLLFAVVQGGADLELRRRCARELVAMGFDGYGFGGYPFDKEGKLVEAPVDAVREEVPAGAPLFALGVGSFEAVTAFHARGFRIFDCALPTRDARRGRLYTLDGGTPKRLYLEDERHVRARGPVSEGCDCLACAGHSLGFLRHLFVREDPLFVRLASIHNLRALTRFVDGLGA